MCKQWMLPHFLLTIRLITLHSFRRYWCSLLIKIHNNNSNWHQNIVIVEQKCHSCRSHSVKASPSFLTPTSTHNHLASWLACRLLANVSRAVNLPESSAAPRSLLTSGYCGLTRFQTFCRWVVYRWCILGLFWPIWADRKSFNWE